MTEPLKTPLAIALSEFPWRFRPEHATLPEAGLCRLTCPSTTPEFHG